MIRNIYILLLLSLSYSQPNNFSYNATSQQAIYYFELVSIDDIPIAAGEDWVGAFNGDVCVGASQCGSGICSVPVMGYDGMAHSEGYMQNGDIPSFKIYDSSENVYYGAIPSEDIPWQNLAFNVIDSLTVFRDCNGVLGGMAYEDDCGLCDSDPTNDCFYECDLGDVNCDGTINVIDIVMAVDLILNDNYDVVGDVNEDGQLNVIDIVMMVDWVLNGIPETTVTDADGNVYETIQIGEQLWMADNLRVGHYNNYETIPAHFDFYDWIELTTGACLSIGDSLYFYESDELNEIYGKLYNWYAVNDERGICPNGFHVPSDDDWTTLSTFLDANSDPFSYYGVQSNVAGGMLKSTGNIQEVTGLWSAPNTAATNESGFTAVPAGFRSGDYGNYGMFTNGNYYWSTSVDYDEAWNRAMYFDLSGLFRFSVSKNHAYSVRCLKD